MTDSITKKMSAMQVAEVSSNEIVEKLTRDALRGLYRVDHRNADLAKAKRIQLVAHVKSSVNYSAAKTLLAALSTEQLGLFLAPVGIQHAHNNEKSRVVLTKRLMEQLTRTSVADFITEYSDVELIKSFFESLDMAVPKTSKKESLVEQLCDELDREGLRIYLDSLPIDVLRDVAFDLKLEDDAESQASRKALIKAITTLEKVEEPKSRKPEKIVFSAKKPKIKAGVTYQDLFQHYNVTELVKFAKDNEIKSGGTKKELINRIIAWLEGDKENTVVGTRKAPKKKRGGNKKAAKTEETAEAEDEDAEEEPIVEKKKPAGKPKKAPTPVESEEEDEEEDEEEEEVEEPAPAPKKTAKKAAPAPKKAAPAEEDDGIELGDDDEIDLDNLEQYSTKFLRQYCNEEGLKPKGNTKKDFMAAIIAYNEESEGEEDQ